MVSKVSVGIGLHVNQINHTIDILFKANWQVNRECILTKALVNRLKRLVKIATGLVNLIDKADAWHAVLISLAPYGFGLCFDTHLAVKDRHGTVEYAQAALHLGSKVNMAWGIDNINLAPLPETSYGCARNRNTALALLVHPVGGCTAIITAHSTNLVVNTGSVQDTFSRCCFACIDMGNNTNIAVLIEGVFFFCHRGCYVPLLSIIHRSLLFLRSKKELFTPHFTRFTQPLPSRFA